MAHAPYRQCYNYSLMQISRLWLLNFRNYENATIDFTQNNLLVGPNGAGKTNILEAIDILATSRSRIVRGLNKCIRHSQQGFVINGHFGFAPRLRSGLAEYPRPSSTSSDRVAAAEMTIAFRQERSEERTIKIDEETLARTSELIGKVNSVIFLPGDLDLIRGAPALRRKYLDIIISQTEQGYYQDLQNYTRALRQRNELLKNLRWSGGSAPPLGSAQGSLTSRSDQLDVWDTQLAECAGRIMLKRNEYLEFFARETAELYNTLGFSGTVTLKYKTAVQADKQKNLEALTAARAEDLRFGRTHWGVQADDFEFYLDDSKAAEFCSQGQRRLLAIAFKCAEAKIKTEKLKDPPIVLVDDVLLELDLERLNKIISAIAPQSQKIFTVTDTGRFSPDILREMKIIKIENGRLT